MRRWVSQTVNALAGKLVGWETVATLFRGSIALVLAALWSQELAYAIGFPSFLLPANWSGPHMGLELLPVASSAVIIVSAVVLLSPRAGSTYTLVGGAGGSLAIYRFDGGVAASPR